MKNFFCLHFRLKMSLLPNFLEATLSSLRDQLSSRSELKLNSLVDEIRASGGEATPIVADVEVFDQVKAIADRTVEVCGRLDTWVHCPAIALGVKPAGIPPYYDPKLVADAILYVAEHPTRDFFVGDAARALDALQRLSPELVDSLLLLIGFRLQRSSEPKSEADFHLS
jgi:hypothetical protein